MPSIHWPIIRECLASPLRTAMVDDQRAWRAIDVLVASQHIAAELSRVSGARTVGIMLPTGGTFPAAALAAWSLGRVVVPLNYLLRKEELQYVIDDCETDVVITATPMLEHLGFTPQHARLVALDRLNFKGLPELRWPRPADPDDLGVLIYTSGTSGRPKGVMLSHGNITSNVAQYLGAVSITSQDVMLGVLPQFHSFGFTVLTMAPLTIGCKVVYSARFVPSRIVKLIREHRPTIFVAIPSMYHALLSVKDAAPEDFASLRLAVSGGEPLPFDVACKFKQRFGVTINEGYGLTETSPATNVCLPDDHREKSVGPPLRGVLQRIVPVQGMGAHGEGSGEIRMKGPNIMQGYFKLPAESAAAFDDEGWFRTGDIGRFDAAGHLYITGRLKEMMIVGGENVFPREIEEVLDAHPGVHASAVIGAIDPVRGEVPVAFIEMREGAVFEESDLRTWCRDRLAGYKVPRDIRRLDALPRNPTGKIMRRELKKQL